MIKKRIELKDLLALKNVVSIKVQNAMLHSVLHVDAVDGRVELELVLTEHAGGKRLVLQLGGAVLIANANGFPREVHAEAGGHAMTPVGCESVVHIGEHILFGR